MHIWRLKPVDLGDPSWQASSHRGIAIVRAPDEQSAREAAQQAFGVSTRFPPGAGVSGPPWLRANLVEATIIKPERFDPNGPVGVLEPSFDTDL